MNVPEFVTNPNPYLYYTGRWVALDFETHNLEKGSALIPENHLVLTCWTTGQGATVFDSKHSWNDEYGQQELLEDIANCDFLIAQNAKFELQWLHRCGYVVGTHPVFDTMLAEWVLSGNRKWPLDLDSLSEKYGGHPKSPIISRLMNGGVSPAHMPRSLLLRYGKMDVANTIRIMQAQLGAMEGTRLLPVVYTRCLTTLVLADIERSGVFLDKTLVEEEYESTLKEYIAVKRQLDEFTGGINMNSPKQKAEFLYDTLKFDELRNRSGKKPLRTAKDQRKTDADTIAALVATTDKQRQFVALQQQISSLNAALTKTLEFFVGVCREYDSTFFGEIRQGVARTHRLASAGKPLEFKAFPKKKSCQFQNFPNRYKKLLRARNSGWFLAEADAAQLEFRVGGHLGNDAQILADVIHQEDIHSCTAAALTKAGEPTSRRDAKASTFKPMYGGTRGSPAVEAYCKFFAEKYHELNTAQRNWALTAANDKMIETEWGMRYYFNDVKVQADGYISGQQKVFNYPIQGLATGEIIPIGLVHFWYRTRDMKLIIVNTVHDSIICEVPEDEIELFRLNVVQALTRDVYNYLDKAYNIVLKLPLGVSTKIGTHWGASAFSDEELQGQLQSLVDAGYEPVVDDGEVSVDV